MAVSKTILKTTREFRVNTDEEAKNLLQKKLNSQFKMVIL